MLGIQPSFILVHREDESNDLLGCPVGRMTFGSTLPRSGRLAKDESFLLMSSFLSGLEDKENHR